MDVVLILAVLAWLYLRGKGGASTALTADYPDGGNTVQGMTQSIANAIAKFEGFFVSGSLPSRTHNPGDIGTYNGKVRTYASDAAGFDALDNYITAHASAHPDWDLYDFVRYYLTGDTMGTPGPNQDPDGYADFIAKQTGIDPTQSLFSQLG